MKFTMAILQLTEEPLAIGLNLLVLMGTLLFVPITSAFCYFAWWYIQRYFKIRQFYNYRHLVWKLPRRVRSEY